VNKKSSKDFNIKAYPDIFVLILFESMR